MDYIVKNVVNVEPFLKNRVNPRVQLKPNYLKYQNRFQPKIDPSIGEGLQAVRIDSVASQGMSSHFNIF